MANEYSIGGIKLWIDYLLCSNYQKSTKELKTLLTFIKFELGSKICGHPLEGFWGV